MPSSVILLQLSINARATVSSATNTMRVGQGLRYTNASHIVVFLYTAPVFAALGLHWRLPAERLQRLQWVGILLAFGGIVIAFFARSSHTVSPFASNILLGDFLGLLGGIAWGATTVVVRCSSLARSFWSVRCWSFPASYR
jgi:drug/metabolite transporter (DMT)-like permease